MNATSTKIKFDVTAKGEKRTYEIKAETKEQAAIKGAIKFFFGFKPVSATPKEESLSNYAYAVSDKSGKSHEIYAIRHTGEQAEANDLYL